MSVRHIRAKRGEHIVVHRPAPSGGGGGCGAVIVILLIVGAIGCGLAAILSLLAWLAIFILSVGLIFMIIKFRWEIWNAIKWFVGGLWRLFLPPLAWSIVGIKWIAGVLRRRNDG